MCQSWVHVIRQCGEFWCVPERHGRCSDGPRMKPWLACLFCLLACNGDAEESGTGDVSCGSVTCNRGDVCVQPGQICEPNPSPHYVTPDPYCRIIPESCSGDSGEALRGCLSLAYCDASATSAAPFDDNILRCYGAMQCP